MSIKSFGYFSHTVPPNMQKANQTDMIVMSDMTEDGIAAEPTPVIDDGAGTATQVLPKKSEPKSDRKPGHLPPYKVLLHNDDVNDMEHVIQTILKLTTLALVNAVKCTLEAHDTGVSLLLVTHKERAELYAEQFASRLLTVTIEPADG